MLINFSEPQLFMYKMNERKSTSNFITIEGGTYSVQHMVGVQLKLSCN